MIEQAILDRFGRWGRFLRRQRATPILVVGLQVDTNRPVVTTCEDTPDELIRDTLAAVLAALEAGKVDHY